ncbi:MAG TPA: hypothetical protein PKM43_05605 [Verrucomicrobiota bacterium]|nr:hypothetical protein [Verrucomicrobiota bacterium]
MKRPTTNHPSWPVWKTKVAWLTAIPTLIIFCLAAMPRPQSSPGSADSNAPQLEGSWLVKVTLDLENGPPPFETLVSCTAGGVALSSDPSVYPLYPMQTAYHGAWARKHGREFAFRMIGYQWDETVDPPVLWKAVITETVTVEPGGDAYHGEGTVAWYYPNGEFAGIVEDTTQAIRIKAE